VRAAVTFSKLRNKIDDLTQFSLGELNNGVVVPQVQLIVGKSWPIRIPLGSEWVMAWPSDIYLRFHWSTSSASLLCPVVWTSTSSSTFVEQIRAFQSSLSPLPTVRFTRIAVKCRQADEIPFMPTVCSHWTLNCTWSDLRMLQASVNTVSHIYLTPCVPCQCSEIWGKTEYTISLILCLCSGSVMSRNITCGGLLHVKVGILPLHPDKLCYPSDGCSTRIKRPEREAYCSI